MSNAAVADGYAGLALRCRAHIADSRLSSPFWLQFEHFDPARSTAKHTAAQALRVYRTSPNLRGFPHAHARAAYADYTDANGQKRPAVPVWIVVTYGVRATSFGPSGGSMRADRVAIINDADLRPRSVLETLPSRCV